MPLGNIAVYIVYIYTELYARGKLVDPHTFGLVRWYLPGVCEYTTFKAAHAELAAVFYTTPPPRAPLSLRLRSSRINNASELRETHAPRSSLHRAQNKKQNKKKRPLFNEMPHLNIIRAMFFNSNINFTQLIAVWKFKWLEKNTIKWTNIN